MKNLKATFLCSKKKERGLSLIEVMLASLILSFALIGFLQGQLIALRASEQAYFINLADLKNNELAERIRSCSNLFCIQEQLNLWKEEVNRLLPKGKNLLVVHGTDYQSKLSWNSTRVPKFWSIHLLFQV